jgi:hypothetical protein
MASKRRTEAKSLCPSVIPPVSALGLLSSIALSSARAINCNPSSIESYEVGADIQDAAGLHFW